MSAHDEEDDAPRARQRCVDCSRISPKTLTAHTLISSQHGWRVIRTTDQDGNPSYEWRCRDCWQKRRDREKSPL